jgi:hypothetical protein
MPLRGKGTVRSVKKPAGREWTRSAGSFLLGFDEFLNYLAGAAGAAGAGAGAAGASGAGAAGAAGAGASAAFGASAGFCSSAFLHPTTAKDNAAKKNNEKMTANTFFI